MKDIFDREEKKSYEKKNGWNPLDNQLKKLKKTGFKNFLQSKIKRYSLHSLTNVNKK